MGREDAIKGFERRRAWSLVQVGGLGILIACAVMWFLPGHAYAQGESVTIPSGPLTDGQTITVTGTGFPPTSQLPTGLQIIECSDPGGLAVNLPTDAASGCDGTTINGSQINTDATGAFSASYSISALSATGNSNINCDATDFCVLWVGQDYNAAFLSGPHAFSVPFEIATTTTTTTTLPTGTTTTLPTGTTTSTTTSSTTTTLPTGTTTSTTTSSTTTTLPTGATTTSSPLVTTTTSTTTSSTTTTLPTGTTTTSVVGSGTTTTQAASSAGTTGSSGGGSSPVAASSSQLAFTGAPPFLPWLAGFGFLMSVVGLVGRRLIPDGPV